MNSNNLFLPNGGIGSRLILISMSVVVNGKKKFVNPTYEGKSYNWKQIYRAGREVIEPAISFAEQWIREIN